MTLLRTSTRSCEKLGVNTLSEDGLCEKAAEAKNEIWGVWRLHHGNRSQSKALLASHLRFR